MLVLHRCGRSVEALELFRQTKDRMAHETGLDPSPSLCSLQLSILRADPELQLSPGRAAVPAEPLPVAVAGPAQLPPAVSLVGRTRELALLNEALDETTAASGPLFIAAIDGPAGVGKTALA